MHWLGKSQNSMVLLRSLSKNFLSLLEINDIWIWNGCDNESNILFAVWMESVMIMICSILGKLVTWLIPHLVAKILALVNVTFIAWWTVLIIGLSWTWIYTIEVATWFLTLVLDTIIADFRSADAWRIMLLRLQMCIFILSLLCLFVEWKEKWLGKTSISLSPEENSLLNRSNNGKISLILLSIPTTRLLMFKCCFEVSLFNNNWWVLYSFACLDSRSDFKIWLDSKECALSWDLPLSFQR